MEALLDVDTIVCQYDGQTILHGLSLHLRPGSLGCLLGPSGCGKTTALRAIAGFMPLVSGQIRLHGTLVASSSYSLPAEQRRIGMVFQDYALFPHLNLIDNVAFGLLTLSTPERQQRAQAMLELVGLAGRARAYPHELSGGQQQRVALARALAPQPQLLLLDEPFSSLDVELRERLAYEVRDILRAQNITGLLVTHDQHEAFALAEQVGVMQGGRLLQWDTPYNLYHEPADRFVADFIGQGCLLPGTLLDHERLQTPVGVLAGNRALVYAPGTELEVLLRPDDVVLDSTSALEVRVLNKAFKGAETLYTLGLDNGTSLLSLFPSHQDYPIGAQVRVRVAPEQLVVFPRA